MTGQTGVLRRIKNVITGRDLFQRLQIDCPHQFFGSEYGGWSVVTSCLDKDSVIYSFGVGEDISFDVAFIEALGATVHAFDPTPRSADWLATQPTPAGFVFHPYGLADHDGSMTFFEPKDRRHISHSTLAHGQVDDSAAHQWQVRRLETIVQDLGHNHVDVLKMDIEGGEYSVIDALCCGVVRPTQILVEFHHHFQGITRHQSLAAIRALHAVGYRIFSISPTAVEYGFIHDSYREQAHA